MKAGTKKKPDEYRKPVLIETGEYRYMGHFIQDQRGWNNLPPWISFPDDGVEDVVPHFSFAGAKAWCKRNRIDNPESKLEECYG